MEETAGQILASTGSGQAVGQAGGNPPASAGNEQTAQAVSSQVPANQAPASTPLAVPEAVVPVSLNTEQASAVPAPEQTGMQSVEAAPVTPQIPATDLPPMQPAVMATQPPAGGQATQNIPMTQPVNAIPVVQGVAAQTAQVVPQVVQIPVQGGVPMQAVVMPNMIIGQVPAVPAQTIEPNTASSFTTPPALAEATAEQQAAQPLVTPEQVTVPEGTGLPEQAPEVTAGEAVQPTNGQGNQGDFQVANSNPLHDLYNKLSEQAQHGDLMLQQQMEAERRHKSFEQMEEEAAGWRLTSYIAIVLMILSWCLAGITIAYPFLGAGAKSQDRSINFTLFIVSIMFLLTGTLLSIWVRSPGIIKKITWTIFLLFILLFILVSLKSVGILSFAIPGLDPLLTRLVF